jgi:hypothetical protein
MGGLFFDVEAVRTEARPRCSAQAERLARELDEAKQSLVRARNKLKASNAQRGSTETLASVSATSSPPPPRRSREKSPRRKSETSPAPPPPAKRRGVDVGTQSPRRKHKDDAAPSPAPPQKRRGVDAGTQSPKPRTTSTGVQSPRPPQEPRRAESPAPARRAPRTVESEDQTLVASVESVPPPPPPVAPDLEGEATKEQLELRALRTELEREREINRRLGEERDAPEEELGVYKERAAALRDALEQATRDAEKEMRLRREAEETLHAVQAQKPDADALTSEVNKLRSEHRDMVRELSSSRETARLAAEDAARLHRALQLRGPGTTTEVAVAALAAQVDELELRAKRRQEEVASAVLEANASAKLELARHETRAAEALAAKDAQLMRFRGELDSLLDALRAAVADKARAQAAVSEKLAQDHLEFAAEAFDVGAE